MHVVSLVGLLLQNLLLEKQLWSGSTSWKLELGESPIG